MAITMINNKSSLRVQVEELNDSYDKLCKTFIDLCNISNIFTKYNSWTTSSGKYVHNLIYSQGFLIGEITDKIILIHSTLIETYNAIYSYLTSDMLGSSELDGNDARFLLNLSNIPIHDEVDFILSNTITFKGKEIHDYFNNVNSKLKEILSIADIIGIKYRNLMDNVVNTSINMSSDQIIKNLKSEFEKMINNLSGTSSKVLDEVNININGINEFKQSISHIADDVNTSIVSIKEVS